MKDIEIQYSSVKQKTDAIRRVTKNQMETEIVAQYQKIMAAFQDGEGPFHDQFVNLLKTEQDLAKQYVLFFDKALSYLENAAKTMKEADEKIRVGTR